MLNNKSIGRRNSSLQIIKSAESCIVLCGRGGVLAIFMQYYFLKNGWWNWCFLSISVTNYCTYVHKKNKSFNFSITILPCIIRWYKGTLYPKLHAKFCYTCIIYWDMYDLPLLEIRQSSPSNIRKYTIPWGFCWV